MATAMNARSRRRATSEARSPSGGVRTAERAADRGAHAREQLVVHATRIFAAKGYAATSTREICQAAGTNVAAIHYYFGDKEGLYREVLTRPVSAIAAEFGNFDDPSLPFEHAIRRVLHPFVAMALDDNPDALHVERVHLREALESSPVFRDVVARLIVPQHDALASVLARHCGLRRADAAIHQLAFALIAMANDYCMSREFMKLLAPRGDRAPRRGAPHRRPAGRVQRRAARLREGTARRGSPQRRTRPRAPRIAGHHAMIEHRPVPRARRLLPWGVLALLIVVGGAAVLWFNARHEPANGPQPTAASSPRSDAPARPALTVALVQARREEWPRTLAAQGNVTAWQEAAVGAELSGFRITEVLVNVGDRVRKGQPLARMNAESVDADRNQARASVAEAEAVLAEARANALRSRDLAAKGFVSPQAATQAATAAETAAARLAAAQARLQAEDVRLAQTVVLAPDEGTISARTATVGALTQPGQELFRLIRGNRLEWRAEVTASEVDRIAPGMAATLRLPGGADVIGRVRTVAPTVDPQTRNALVYVDLPIAATNPARPGMFARGEFDLGRAPALTLPETAVVQREGFAYTFRVDGNSRVVQTKIGVGRRVGERIEVTQGLDPDAQVVASGAGFLADGDLVRVVSPGTVANR